ncbi:hypothetical protein T265_06789 [Opisthorchis viverrini]|uniref:Uncharacterized protein n=1 Tax=Opisthorchis viverrini TaxID=6198 RepID=A0A074ZJ67_OPIVI|nr:hypothetical protein T265_06789 [Opisthorchis viverrini]KER25812.1 hypothetical protein T265_06789 [Opisthorchis viverrini]
MTQATVGSRLGQHNPTSVVIQMTLKGCRFELLRIIVFLGTHLSQIISSPASIKKRMQTQFTNARNNFNELDELAHKFEVWTAAIVAESCSRTYDFGHAQIEDFQEEIGAGESALI